jgi:hypothetical protein
MIITRTGLVKHARYIAWRTKFVKSLNIGDLMTASGLDYHLFHWGIDAGLMNDPGPILRQPYSAYVAVIFEKQPEAVEREIRQYQLVLAKERDSNGRKVFDRGLFS